MLILVVTVLYIGDKTVRCRIVRDIAKPSDKEKREVDFLITSNRKPWLLAECKLSDKSRHQRLPTSHASYAQP